MERRLVLDGGYDLGGSDTLIGTDSPTLVYAALIEPNERLL